jgi:ATP-binding cassette subfamily B protein
MDTETKNSKLKTQNSTGKAFWALVRYRPGNYLLNFFIWGSFYALPLGFGLLTREFFNILSAGEGVGTGVWTIIALFMGVALGRIITLALGMLTWSDFWYTIDILLKKNMMGWMVRGPGSRRLHGSAGEAVSTFRDDPDHMMHYIDGWLDLAGEMVFVVVALIVMWSISPAITLVSALPLFAIVTVTNLLTSRIRKYRKAAREATSQVTGAIGELFGGVQAIKVASAEAHAIGHFRAISEKRRKAALKDSLLTQMLESFNANSVNIGMGLVLILAAQAMQSGSFGVGDFALFISYLEGVASAPTWIGRMIARYKQVGVSVERMEKMVEGSPEGTVVQHGPVYVHGESDLPEVPYKPKTASDRLKDLRVEGLSYRYPETGRGIEGINLRLRPGSFTVITGRVGSGKSTLLKALLGLVPKDEGSIRWNEQTVEDPASFMVPPHSAYTPQVPRLFSETLRDNILMGLPTDRTDLDAAIHLAVMERDVEGMEGGLETVVGPKGVRLSGGQIQRAAAARMLVRDPELLVFDDLSSALDVETEQLLWERIFAHREGEVACLVVSHRRAVLRQASHIVVLKEGKVEAEGTLDELLLNSEEMRRLWSGDPAFWARDVEVAGVSEDEGAGERQEAVA